MQLICRFNHEVNKQSLLRYKNHIMIKYDQKEKPQGYVVLVSLVLDLWK